MKTAKITAAVPLTAILLVGCSCQHEWVEADCVTAKTCSKCGETEGEALGHSWAEADCLTAKTCTRCGETEGEALGHDMVGATYQTAAACSRCGAEGEKLTAYFEEKGWKCNSSRAASSGSGGGAQTDEISRFAYDNDHPAKEGYEWIKVSTMFYLSKEEYDNATGFCCLGWTDYYRYDYSEFNSEWDGENSTFCVNWQGEEYADCSAEMVEGDFCNAWIPFSYPSGTVNNWLMEYDYYFLVPIGYDGIVIYGAELTPEEWEKYDEITEAEILDGNVARFRIDERMEKLVAE